MKKIIMLVVLFLNTTSISIASENKENNQEVKTIDGIIAALYDVISGPAGERDWERLKFLCKPSVQFNMVVKNKDGKNLFIGGNIEKYIQSSGVYFLKNNFHETETARKTHEFGPIAQVFSAFQSSSEQAGKPFDSGVNSIQLCYDQERWWVVNVIWTSETEENTVQENF